MYHLKPAGTESSSHLYLYYVNRLLTVTSAGLQNTVLLASSVIFLYLSVFLHKSDYSD